MKHRLWKLYLNLIEDLATWALNALIYNMETRRILIILPVQIIGQDSVQVLHKLVEFTPMLSNSLMQLVDSSPYVVFVTQGTVEGINLML